MAQINKEIEAIAKNLLDAVKNIAPELATEGKKAPFQITIENDKKGLSVEIKVDKPFENTEVKDVHIPEGVDATSYILGIEREHIKKALTDTGGNYKAAAELLGISIRSLKRKLAQMNL